jgi:hypothetical protein
LVAQPVVFAIAVVLGRYSSYATTLESVVRPVLIVSVVALLALLIARMLTGGWAWAAILANAFVLLSLREPLVGGVMLAVGVWWLVIRLARRIGHRAPPAPGIPRAIARASGILALGYLGVMSVNAAVATVDEPVIELPRYTAAGTGGPNIYVVLLDGYPRADTLNDRMQIDNSGFLEALGELGFDVANQARTNYNKTWLTLASMLNGMYLADMLGDTPIPEDSAVQLRWLHHLIERSAMLDLLRGRGYVVRTVPPPFQSSALTSADEVMSPGGLTEFEAQLIRDTPWTLLLQDPARTLLADSQRGQVTRALGILSEVSERGRTDRPQFTLVHVQSPHTPFVLGDDHDSQVLDCFPVLCSAWSSTVEEMHMPFPAYRQGLANQIAVLNDLVLDAVRDVVASDPEGVIVLMSDHGSRYSLADPAEHYRSLLAVRSVAFPNLVPEDESPVNLLRRLFTAYFDAELDPLPYQAWISDWTQQYLRLEPVDLEELR